MALGRQGDRQGDLVVTWREMPRSPGHVFYDRLQGVLIEAGFDAFAEATCKPYYAAKMGAPSVPPGRYFRMHMVGYFEGIDSERGIEWRCADSLSLQGVSASADDRAGAGSFLAVEDALAPAAEVHETVFGWVLALIAERGLVKGERIGVDASTMEANAALRTIVRRDSGETYREMLKRMAAESGIETPSADDLVRMDRARKGKKLSNADWVSGTDPEAKIARMKDGTTHLAYKPEHAVDLDTGAVVAAEIHPADDGDTTTLPGTLEAAAANLAKVDSAPTTAETAELVADKGYHSRAVLKDLDGGVWKTRIAEPQRRSSFAGTAIPRRGTPSTPTATAFARRSARRECENGPRSSSDRSPTTLERGGMRRTWLRGRENVHKRYLIHVAGHNLGILMRHLIGAGTPKEAAARGRVLLFVVHSEEILAMVLFAVPDADGRGDFGLLIVAVTANPT